jgi:protein-tyrosine phosphatase
LRHGGARGPSTGAVDTLQNVRDLGGIPVARGGRIRPGVLYRGDAPFPADADPALRPWPPRTVIDLRSADEGGSPHPIEARGATLLHLPLFGAASPASLVEGPSGSGVDLTAIYLEMIRSGESTIVQALRVISESPPPILLHCTAGKDRTGVVVAILLATLGVPEQSVVADYRRTEYNMARVLRRIASTSSHPDLRAAVERVRRERPELLTAPPEAIGTVLAVLAAHPAGPEGWLLERGLETERMATLRRLLIEPGRSRVALRR